MSQALYRKWRPGRWEEVVGQQHVVQTVRNAISAGREAHAYLFAGPRGTGKTTLARMLAKAVNCLNEDLAVRPCDECAHCQSVSKGNFLDLIEIDAASNTSVEDVRDLRDKINFSPNLGRYKVYIIDEVHMLSTAAFNALLKTLEEPPAHAIFVLATTEVHKIPATVLSRCQRHEFRRISVNDIVSHLKKISKEEGIKVDDEALGLIARQAAGGMRDAISLLDQLSAAGEKITLEMAQTVLGTATSQSVLDIVDAIQAKEAAGGLNAINAALDAGTDPRQFARQTVEYLRSVMLVRMGNGDQVDTTADLREQMAKHAQAFEAADLLRIIKGFNQAAVNRSSTWQPSLPLELAVVEAVEGPPPETPAPLNTPPEPKHVSKKPTSKAPAAKAKPKKSASSKTAVGLTNEKWQAVLSNVKKASPNTNGLLNSSKSRELREGVLYIGFTTEVLMEKMAQEEHLSVLQKAIEKVIGSPVEISCIITGSAGELPAGVDNSGMVATAVRLGGEVVDENELSKKSE